MEHAPVLRREVVEILRPVRGERVLDCTLGLGGHAAVFLDAVGLSGSLTGLDLDVENLDVASSRLAARGFHPDLRLGNFGELEQMKFPAASFDIIFADLGLSSPHLDDPMRGFSFRTDGPLDLRFDRTNGQTASELIGSVSEQDLEEILREYGELKIAKKLAWHLKQQPQIATTFQLAERVRGATEHGASSILPQVFQALRIAVNDELHALDSLLLHAPKLLSAQGRLGIISYHSLEDRRVKQAFHALCEPERHPLSGAPLAESAWISLTSKALRPTTSEVAENSRARSARFRAIIRFSHTKHA